MKNQKKLLIVAANSLPYGKNITKVFQEKYKNDFKVDFLEVDVSTKNFLYFISRNLKILDKLKSIYAKKLIKTIKIINPDYIVFFLGPCPFTKNDFLELKKINKSIFIYTWLCDVLDYNKNFIDFIKLSNKSGSFSKSDINLLSKKLNIEIDYLPMFYDPDIFFDGDQARNFDVTFVGTWSNKRLSNRRMCLSWLSDLSEELNLNTIIIARSSIKNPILYILDLIKGRKFAKWIKPGPKFGEEIASIYRKSKIVIDCSADNQLDSSPTRRFEALACGSTVLTYKKERFDKNDNYFSSKSELRQLINKAILNKREFNCEEIREHTIEARVEIISQSFK